MTKRYPRLYVLQYDGSLPRRWGLPAKRLRTAKRIHAMKRGEYITWRVGSGFQVDFKDAVIYYRLKDTADK